MLVVLTSALVGPVSRKLCALPTPGCFRRSVRELEIDRLSPGPHKLQAFPALSLILASSRSSEDMGIEHLMNFSIHAPCSGEVFSACACPS